MSTPDLTHRAGAAPRRRALAALLTAGALLLSLLAAGSPPAGAATAPSVTGTVTAGGSPLVGAQVRVLQGTYGNLVGSGTTTAGGAFAVTLPAWTVTGSIKVEVTAPTTVYGRTYNGNVTTFAAAPAISVPVGATVSAGTIAMVADRGRIGGTVSALGAPATGVGGVRVEIWSSYYGAIVTTATTAPDGTYRSAPLNPGAYKVRFIDLTGTRAAVWHGGGLSFDKAANVTVTAGPTTTVDAALPLSASIDGRVTAGDSTVGLPGLYVIAATTGPAIELAGGAITDATGSYHIAGLQPGTYRVVYIDPLVLSDATQALRPEFWVDTDILSAASLEAAFLVADDITLAEGGVATADEGLVGAACPTVAGLPALVGADLSGLNIIGCDLSGRDLTGATITGTKVTGVDLTDADLGNADGTPADAANAVYGNTTCPDYTNSDDNGGTCVGHFTREAIAPTVEITGPTATASDPVELTVSASDAESGLAGAPTCTVDGSPATLGGSGPWTLSVSGAGSHEVACSVDDLAGNTGSDTASVVIDADAPTISVTGPATAVYAATVTVTAGDALSGLAGTPTCTVDGSPATLSGTGPWTLEVVGAGTHTVSCQVADLAGNSASASATVAITADTTAPTWTLNPGPYPVGSFATLTVIDTGSGVTADGIDCRTTVGGRGYWLTATGSGSSFQLDVSALPAGTHKVQCFIVDRAGNQKGGVQNLTVV